MLRIFSNIKNYFYYMIESMKNRYPCKIISIKNADNSNEQTKIFYQAFTRTNVREETVENIINDQSLIEKFHPTDCVRLGFVAVGETIFKQNLATEEAVEKYFNLVRSITKKYKGDIANEKL